MNAKQSFKQVYALTRLNRGNIHFQRQTFRFPGGFIYIGETSLVIRPDNSPTFHPGRYTDVGLRYNSRDYRRYMLERSRDTGPVPLP